MTNPLTYFNFAGSTPSQTAGPAPSYISAAMAPQIYYRRWEVWFRGDRLGDVLAATEKAACLRAHPAVQVQP
jgi:hypothetical protein